MTTRVLTLLAIACLTLPLGALGGERPLLSRDNLIIHGGDAAGAQAVGDTINLMGRSGAGAPYVGDFLFGWNDWATNDLTQKTISHWQVSDFKQADPGNLAAWCGDLGLAGCAGGDDVAGGYGNDWYDMLVYRATVADPTSAAEVTMTSVLQYDTEPGYDYLRLSTADPSGRTFTDLQVWAGQGAETTSHVVTFLPSELLGGTDVAMWFRFQSDDGWSDEDCLWPSAGAVQIDDISLTTRQVGQADMVSFTDFQDGTLGDWLITYPNGVGNFANLWSALEEGDQCATNYTQQVAFLDDDRVVVGTGGSSCITWCYGPGGYIVNTTGGLAGPANHLHNVVESPVMNWPNATLDGITLSYDLYRHEELGADAPGMFVTWGVRSADTDGSAGHGMQSLVDQSFRNHNQLSYGYPAYLRPSHNVTGLMNPGRDEVQVRLGVYELGWLWGWNGNDGYPAPYFDNVAVKVFTHLGPAMTAREVDLAQDNFPEVDMIDLDDLGSLHVRFDMARNISAAGDLRNDPGDSVVVDIVSVRSGAALVGAPTMSYTIDANPLFDAFRTIATSGTRTGVPAVGAAGVAHPTAWAFDLPDTGGLFPGDVLHYYIRASDQVGGDVQHTSLPADLTGFGDFSTPGAYDSRFVVRALPTIVPASGGGLQTPGILFWNDFAAGAAEESWHSAFEDLSLVPGVDYDTYYTNGPDSGVGNGLGGRTAGPALADYDDLCYASGDLGVFTISNGDFQRDAGDDVGALLTWLGTGNKDLFLTGDNVASDLALKAGAEGLAFVEDVMGVDVATNNIRSFISNQATPVVGAVPGAPVFQTSASWIAYGGCQFLNTFDGVTVRSGAMRLAEFRAPGNFPDVYAYSAATLNDHGTGNRIVSMPYDFNFIYTDPSSTGTSTLPARAQVLKDVLGHFDVVIDDVTEEPEFPGFTMRMGPNPFHTAYQRLRLAYTLAGPGNLLIKVYDVRGQLVHTLFDSPVDQAGFVRWDGVAENGVAVPSGVYFVEARIRTDVFVKKFALIR